MERTLHGLSLPLSWTAALVFPFSHCPLGSPALITSRQRPAHQGPGPSKRSLNRGRRKGAQTHRPAWEGTGSVLKVLLLIFTRLLSKGTSTGRPDNSPAAPTSSIQHLTWLSQLVTHSRLSFSHVTVPFL